SVFVNDFRAIAASGDFAAGEQTLDTDLAAIARAAGPSGTQAVLRLNNDVSAVVSAGSATPQQSAALNQDLANLLGTPIAPLAIQNNTVPTALAPKPSNLGATDLTAGLVDFNAVSTSTSRLPAGQSGGETTIGMPQIGAGVSDTSPQGPFSKLISELTA